MTEAEDLVGAFVPGETFALAERPSGPLAGPLAGVTFAAKDLFDVAGRRTGGGNPHWKETHAPAIRHARAVQSLLDASAVCVGKTVTDELAYGLSGRNAHYGVPRNGAAPDRLPGGSSSGSASAVSNRLCDVALGTDSGGSVRVPASYCGLFGMRPTHGRISLDGCMKLAPSYDTCGWFARDAALLERVGLVLLGSATTVPGPIRLIYAADLFRAVDTDVAAALAAPAQRLRDYAGAADDQPLFADNLHVWHEASRTMQGFEIWRTHGDWIATARPVFGADVQARFDFAAKVAPAAMAAAERVRASVSERMQHLLPDGTILCLPTVPTVPPQREIEAAILNDIRRRTLELTCIAGLAHCPQVTIPAATAAGLPCGLSLLARPGADEVLLGVVRAVFGG